MRYQVTVDGERVVVDIDRVPGGGYDVRLGNRRVDAQVFPLDEGVCVHLGGRVFDLVMHRRGAEWVVAAGGFRGRVALEDDTARETQRLGQSVQSDEEFDVRVVSPVPGTIVKVLVKPGDCVQRGDALIVLETMKMENELVASHSATVVTVHVAPGDRVDSEQVLLGLQPLREASGNGSDNSLLTTGSANGAGDASDGASDDANGSASSTFFDSPNGDENADARNDSSG